jgi:hypothetical protein
MAASRIASVQKRTTGPIQTGPLLSCKGTTVAKRGWQRPFEDPIPLPRGRQLVTLKDAADCIMKLPKAEQNHERWQAAVACLIGAADGLDFLMHARIGMVRALNKDVKRVFKPGRKDPHWGRRELARDR